MFLPSCFSSYPVPASSLSCSSLSATVPMLFCGIYSKVMVLKIFNTHKFLGHPSLLRYYFLHNHQSQHQGLVEGYTELFLTLCVCVGGCVCVCQGSAAAAGSQLCIPAFWWSCFPLLLLICSIPPYFLHLLQGVQSDMCRHIWVH